MSGSLSSLSSLVTAFLPRSGHSTFSTSSFPSPPLPLHPTPPPNYRRLFQYYLRLGYISYYNLRTHLYQFLYRPSSYRLPVHLYPPSYLYRIMVPDNTSITATPPHPTDGTSKNNPSFIHYFRSFFTSSSEASYTSLEDNPSSSSSSSFASSSATTTTSNYHPVHSTMHSSSVTHGSKNSLRQRIFYLNRSDQNVSFRSNKVVNTKFTLFTFLPKMLIQQFSAPMNLYFLLIAILQLWSTISPVNPITTWAPLILVFLVACIREGIDDQKRAAADTIANSRPYTIYQQGKLIPDCRAENIKVGDLVMINDDDEIPCDLFLLRTANVVSEGVAYLETANLDGETDLKTRKAKPEFSTLPNDELCTLQGKFECEPPNADLYRFEANIKLLSKLSTYSGSSMSNNPLIIQYDDRHATNGTVSSSSSSTSSPYSSSNEQSLVITNEQLLQHGTILRKTGWILGLVIYTGADTKLSQNKTGAPTKTSKSDILINRIVIGIFLIQLTLVAILGLLGTHWKGNENDNYWYLGWDNLAEGNEAVTIPYDSSTRSLSTVPSSERPWYIIWILPLRFLLLSSMFIPISLKVSLDILKVYYGKLITNDLALYDEETDTPATVANTDIGEDLGKIDVVLSDKTGTLTENIMALCNVSIGGQIYGRSIVNEKVRTSSGSLHRLSTEDQGDTDNGTDRTNASSPQQPLLADAHGTPVDGSSPKQEHSDLSDPALVHALSEGKPDVLDFFRALALCNTVAPEHVNAVPMSPLAEQWSASAGKRPRKSSNTGRESFGNPNGTGTTGAGEAPTWDELTSTISEHTNSTTMLRFIAEPDSMDDESSLLVRNHSGIVNSPKPTVTTNNILLTPSHPAPFYQLRKRCIQYASSSPDEEALVHAAARIGVALTHRRVLAGDVQRVSLRYNTDIINYHKLHSLASNESTTVSSSWDKSNAHHSRFHPSHPPQPSSSSTNRERIPSYVSGEDEKDVIAGLSDDDPSTKRVWVTDTQPEVIYDILCVLPFTSDRRRMSVIVRRIDGGLHASNKGTSNHNNSNAFTIEGNDLMVITKGADDMLRPRLLVNDNTTSTNSSVANGLSLTQRLAYTETENHLETFAQRGLRTLLVAAKPLSQGEYDQWRPVWDNAMHEMGKSKEVAIHQACDLIEKDLYLLGATAIEDRLQDGVPETISALRSAGISVWMLTGDKWSTAIQIAQAAHLLELPHRSNRNNDSSFPTGTKLIEIHGGASADIERDLMTAYRTLRTMRKEQEQQESSFSSSDSANRDEDHLGSSPDVTLSVPVPKSSYFSFGSSVSSWFFSSVAPKLSASPQSLPKPVDATLVIEGSALPDILTDKQHITAFTTLALSCSSVICCRCTPAQKASLVSLVKSTGALALAIGDGGNDVAMIQAANVGIGISGREGQQAARASDYAIAKFRYLLPLIFVHGRFANYRTALVSGYTIYKSAALAIVQLLSNISCGFSGCSLFDTYALTTYNMVYTAIPGLALALDMDYTTAKLLHNPSLYKDSRFSPWYSPRWCFQWGFRALYQGFIIYTFAMMGLGGNLSNWIPSVFPLINGNNYDGSTGDISLVSASAFTALVCVQFVTLTTEVYGLTYLNNLVNLGGFIVYVVIFIIRNYWPVSSSSLGVITAMAYSTGLSSFFTILLTIIVSVLPFIIVRVWSKGHWTGNPNGRGGSRPSSFLVPSSRSNGGDGYSINNGSSSSNTDYVPLNTANAPSRPSLGNTNPPDTRKEGIFASFLSNVKKSSTANRSTTTNSNGTKSFPTSRRTIAASPDTEAGYANTSELELRPFLSNLYEDKPNPSFNGSSTGSSVVPGTSSKDPTKKNKYSID